MVLSATDYDEKQLVKGYKAGGYDWCVTGDYGFLQLLSEPDAVPAVRWFYCLLCDKECTQLSHYESRVHDKMMKKWWKAIANQEEPWKPRSQGGMLGAKFKNTSYAEGLDNNTEEDVCSVCGEGEGDEPKGHGKGASPSETLKADDTALEKLQAEHSVLAVSHEFLKAQVSSLEEIVATLQAKAQCQHGVPPDGNPPGKGSAPVPVPKVSALPLTVPPGVQDVRLLAKQQQEVLDPSTGKGSPPWAGYTWDPSTGKGSPPWAGYNYDYSTGKGYPPPGAAWGYPHGINPQDQLLQYGPA